MLPKSCIFKKCIFRKTEHFGLLMRKSVKSARSYVVHAWPPVAPYVTGSIGGWPGPVAMPPPWGPPGPALGLLLYTGLAGALRLVGAGGGRVE